jgi:hypothetical protein
MTGPGQTGKEIARSRAEPPADGDIDRARLSLNQARADQALGRDDLFVTGQSGTIAPTTSSPLLAQFLADQSPAGAVRSRRLMLPAITAAERCRSAPIWLICARLNADV